MDSKVINIKFLSGNAVVPYRNHETDACYDCVATSVKRYGDGRIEYGLGFSLELPKNTQVDFRARSSIHKTGLILSNGVGTGDEGYQGEYKIVFYHILKGLEPYCVGERVCQLQLRSREDVVFNEVDNLQDSTRGVGGFGSTGA